MVIGRVENEVTLPLMRWRVRLQPLVRWRVRLLAIGAVESQSTGHWWVGRARLPAIGRVESEVTTDWSGEERGYLPLMEWRGRLLAIGGVKSEVTGHW